MLQKKDTTQGAVLSKRVYPATNHFREFVASLSIKSILIHIFG